MMFNLFKSKYPSEETKQMVEDISDRANNIKENERKLAQEPIIASTYKDGGFARGLIIELREHSLFIDKASLTINMKAVLSIDEAIVLKNFLDRYIDVKL
ncbi:MAG: hypothetical protein K0S80_3750 [Neobacillus sp.]|nr:hypothetical protein [Neobacillus sp.]